MKNFLNLILVFSLSTFIFVGFILPLLHLIDMFYEISDVKEMALSVMLYSVGPIIPIGAYNYFTGGSPEIKLPNVSGNIKEGQKPKAGCSSCKKKK